MCGIDVGFIKFVEETFMPHRVEGFLCIQESDISCALPAGVGFDHKFQGT